MTSRPFGAKGEALAQLAASPVLKELHGHPKVRYNSHTGRLIYWR